MYALYNEYAVEKVKRELKQTLVKLYFNNKIKRNTHTQPKNKKSCRTNWQNNFRQLPHTVRLSR